MSDHYLYIVHIYSVEFRRNVRFIPLPVDKVHTQARYYYTRLLYLNCKICIYMELIGNQILLYLLSYCLLCRTKTDIIELWRTICLKCEEFRCNFKHMFFLWSQQQSVTIPCTSKPHVVASADAEVCPDVCCRKLGTKICWLMTCPP